MFTHRRQTTVCFAYHHYYYCCYNGRINNLCHHRLRSSVSPVLTATDFVNGKRQYWPSQNRHPSTDHQKMVQMISLAALPNLVQIRSRKRLGEWLKYKDYLFIYLFIPFFRELTYRSDPSTDFHGCGLNRRGFAQGCAFWGMNRRFQAEQAKYWKFHINETAALISTKFCNDRDHQVVIMGYPNMRPTNPRGPTATI